jgi:inosine-uridine nucleoside N-ribohydrolase
MSKRNLGTLTLIVLAAVIFPIGVRAQERRKIIIDQDCVGPATSDLQAVLVLIQSPQVDPLGITVVSGDEWRDEEVAHTLRMLEIIGRTDIPVVPGAVFPLINSKEETARWEKLFGKIHYQGAWNWGKPHDPFFVPELPEGNPTTPPAAEDAAHFMIRMVHKYPHQVTIYAGGPLTNLALACALDPQFSTLTHELVFMGGSLSTSVDDPEFAATPRREFNMRWDPEAAHMVLRAAWPKITCTTVDISVKTRLTKEMIRQIGQAPTPLAKYLAKYGQEGYMWDELAAAAWLDPSLITRERQLFMDVEIDHGAEYGNTVTWIPGDNPGLGEQLVHLQMDVNTSRLYAMFIDLMTRPTPRPAGKGN